MSLSHEDFALALDGFRFPGRILRRDGNKPPIFFLNGAFQSMASWKKFADFFSPDHTIVLADLPGTGGADTLPRDRGLDFLARAALAVLDHCRIPKAHAVSASYGSPIAYRLAQLAPERLVRVVLAGVMRRIPDHKREPTAETVRFMEEGDMKKFARAVVDGLLCCDPDKTVARGALARRLLLSQLERIPAADKEKYRENTLRLIQHAPLDLSHPPRTPMLVFTGEHDVYTRPKYCREIAATLPDAAFTTLREADHIFHLQQLENTLELLHRFFNHRPLDGSPGCNGFEYFGARAPAVEPETPIPRPKCGRVNLLLPPANSASST